MLNYFDQNRRIVFSKHTHFRTLQNSDELRNTVRGDLDFLLRSRLADKIVLVWHYPSHCEVLSEKTILLNSHWSSAFHSAWYLTSNCSLRQWSTNSSISYNCRSSSIPLRRISYAHQPYALRMPTASYFGASSGLVTVLGRECDRFYQKPRSDTERRLPSLKLPIWDLHDGFFKGILKYSQSSLQRRAHW